MTRLPLSQFRALTKKALRALPHEPVLVTYHSEPLAVLVPWAAYLKAQELLKTEAA